MPDLFYKDEMRLHQILRNLLSNAFKFTEQGSIQLTLTRLEAVQLKAYTTAEPVLAFAVKDSGIGVSVKNQELIFEAFRQADGSTARKFGGTGLGLSISLQLAQLLGGHIELDNTVGSGSTFTLYLPCREQEPEEVPEAVETEVLLTEPVQEESIPAYPVVGGSRQADMEFQQLQGKTVLIVDDDERNIYALQRGLAPYEMNILSAHSGYECLQIIREQPDVDIVLLDIMMPNLDGYDTLSIIRDELALPKLPIIAISAKPIDIKEVVSRMYLWLVVNPSLSDS